ncbi:DNA recombination protein RmuC [Fulvivirga kasyanovii]|uniref:DNA recombination protein RmuC n=1 Tax=Fulvivirga kasyanovii TaxID=396812 RepID=A0ABW9RPT4_9BACT|nr:DNA recombination protein RmuC [Fulvivirga kasyanovii]MTI26168.1 DNA recombination protein RmuC [Fulvivirga kasyanovii]
MEIIWLISGVVLGGAGAWMIAKFKFASDAKDSEAALQVEKERVANLQREAEGLKKELLSERAIVLDLNNKLSSTEADYRNLQEKLRDQKQELEKLQEKFSLEFKNLANEIFEEKSKKFTDQNKVNLGELLNPLREKITEFEKKVELNSKESLEQSTALREQLKGLRELNQQMTREAENLTRALKGDTKTQGNWGEFILESILEKSGLEKGREYLVQESFTNEEGRRFQPDVIIRLPEDKNIIIDSKVSLIAYEKYVTGDETDRDVNLKAHILSIRNHLKGLNLKQYEQLHGVKGLDFILMFVPIEPAFSTAVQSDVQLFNDAYDKNIVIVSPSTLMATLRTIANIWKNEYQSQNALEIARQGGDLYDKFVAFTEDLVKVGNSLDSTQKVYREAMKKLYEGRGNLVNRASKIKELGAKTSKILDQKLIDRASDSE